MTVAQLNETIHQPVRLRAMAALVSLNHQEQMDFTSLARLLDATDGNLGAHLLKLEEVGYVKVEKKFVNRKPRTFLSATHKGRAAFEDHVGALKEVIRSAR